VQNGAGSSVSPFEKVTVIGSASAHLDQRLLALAEPCVERWIVIWTAEEPDPLAC
jgi:hypothetical protein